MLGFLWIAFVLNNSVLLPPLFEGVVQLTIGYANSRFSLEN